jgi:hypothetical protein
MASNILSHTFYWDYWSTTTVHILSYVCFPPFSLFLLEELLLVHFASLNALPTSLCAHLPLPLHLSFLLSREINSLMVHTSPHWALSQSL